MFEILIREIIFKSFTYINVILYCVEYELVLKFNTQTYIHFNGNTNSNVYVKENLDGRKRNL